MPSSPEARLKELGIVLPEPLAVTGSYRPAKRHGDTVYVSGHVSLELDGSGVIAGKVGDDVSVERGYEGARACALHMLSALRAELGSLDGVASILRVFGMVNAAPGFEDLSKVINGCTDQLLEVFGDEVGGSARAAVGMAALPLGAAVETEMVVAVSY